MGICMLAIPVGDRARLRGLLGEMREEHGTCISEGVVTPDAYSTMGICMLAIPVSDRARLRGLLAEMRKEHAYLIYGTVVHRRGTRDWAICHHRLHTGGRGAVSYTHLTLPTNREV